MDAVFLSRKTVVVSRLFHRVMERRWQLALLTVVAGGAYLRLRGLTFQSYWEDELFSAAVSNPDNSFLEVIWRTVLNVHPPLFQFLLWIWFNLFGFSEFSGRLFPALFGIVSIFTMYLLGREVGGRRTGFGCALLTAVNIFHIHYSQEVRSYSLLFLLGSLSLLTFIRFIRKPGNKTLVMYVIVTAAMVYTHYFGLFALAAEGVICLLLLQKSDEETKKIIIKAGVALALLLLPLAPLIIKMARISSFWIQTPDHNFAFDYFRDYFQSAFIAVVCAFGLLCGLIRMPSDPSSALMARILIMWVVLIYLLPYVRSMVSTPMLTGRNTIIALPAFFALIAFGFAQISDRTLYALTMTVLAVMSLFGIFYNPPYYSTVTKSQFREAARALMSENPSPGTVYAPRDAVRNFNVYFSLYNADFRVESLDDFLKSHSQVHAASKTIWVIDGKVRPLFASIQDDKRLNAIAKTKFKEAEFMKMEFAE